MTPSATPENYTTLTDVTALSFPRAAPTWNVRLWVRLVSAAKACLELFLHLVSLSVLDLSHPIRHLGFPLRRAQRVLQHPLHGLLLGPVEGCDEFVQDGRGDHPTNRAAA